MGNDNNNEMKKRQKKRGFVFVGMSLYNAVWNNDMVSVKALIASGADLEEKDAAERTALHEAAKNGFVECAKALLEAKADLETKCDYGGTPLSMAAAYGRVNCVKVRRGWSSSYGWQFCNVSLLQLLIAYKANVNSQDKFKSAALHDAAYSGYLECLEVC